MTSPHHVRARRLKQIGAGLLLTGLVFLAIQYGIRWGADHYLRERAGIPVKIGRLFINPATSRVTVSFAGEKPGQELHLDLGAIRLDWWNVVFKRLRVGRVQMEGLRLDIERDAAGRTMVGGISLATAESTSAPAQTRPSEPARHPWGVGVGGIDLKDLQIDYRDPLVTTTIIIHHFHMDPAESWRADTKTAFESDLSVNGGRVKLSGTCRPFRSAPTLDARIQIADLPLAWLGPAVKKPKLGGQFDGTLVIEGLEVHPSTAAPRVRLKGLELKDSRLSVTDHALRPPFRWKAESLHLQLADIDTADSRAEVPILFEATMGQHESISLKGKWFPFNAIPDGQFDLKVDGFNLIPFTPFAENAVGYRIATGLVDLQTKVRVRQGLLEATNSFTAHKFHLEKLRSDELDESTNQIGLPINLCLSLLRDADDNIRLDVPLTGDLRSPTVPVGKLLWQLLGKALAASLRAAATAFFPSGAKLGFDPVLFGAGDAVLSSEAEAYLTKVSQKLQARPNVGIKLSGIAVPADWYALRKKKIPDPVVAPDPAQVSASDQEQLLALATRRAEALRSYFKEVGSIDPKRLPETAPQWIPTPTGLPRAELSL